MTTRPQLFDTMLASNVGRQGTLFGGSSAVDISCPDCGRLLVMTDSGYLTCPLGCLKLLPDVRGDHADDQGGDRLCSAHIQKAKEDPFGDDK